MTLTCTQEYNMKLCLLLVPISKSIQTREWQCHPHTVTKKLREQELSKYLLICKGIHKRNTLERVRRRWRCVDQMKAGTQLPAALSWSLNLKLGHVLAMLGRRWESCTASVRVRPKSSLIRSQDQENSWFINIVFITGPHISPVRCTAPPALTCLACHRSAQLGQALDNSIRRLSTWHSTTLLRTVHHWIR